MKEAEEIALVLEETRQDKATKGQYNAGTVYEEWGRSLGLFGQTKEAMTYLDRAEAMFGKTWVMQRRDMLMKTARAIVLVRDGEIGQGVALAVEAIDLCRKQGNIRLLERVYAIQQYLDRLNREIGNAGSILQEALAGSIEY
jgi:hypothetical protein